MILIVGDSLTSGYIGIGFSQYLTDTSSTEITFRGIDGDTMLGVTGRAVNYLTQRRISSRITGLVLQCGGNDILLPALLRSDNPQWRQTGRDLIQEGNPPIAAAGDFQTTYRDRIRTVLARGESIPLLPYHIAITTIPPIGEDLSHPLHELRDSHNEMIRELVTDLGIRLIDLDTALSNELRSLQAYDEVTSIRQPYFINDTDNFLNDALYIKKDPASADSLSASRGLHITVDGIHFNSRGAEIAARAFRPFIQSIEQSK